jgi:lipopolysaccharide/colanic/teichoic acid biosynthesis glycosyltransferase
MLLLEKKRSERSQNEFLLILIDIQKLAILKRKNGAVKKLIRILNYFSRESDIKGWYEENRKIGIIYTGITYMSIDSIIEKVKKEIALELTAEQAAAIGIDYYIFPEKSDKSKSVDLNKDIVVYNTISMRKARRRGLAVAKRSIDIIGSVFGILLFSPFIIGISIGIKLFSRGPVFFRQKRVGYGGKEFTLLKFRSMYVDNDNSTHKEFITGFINGKSNSSPDGVFKMKDDPRITPIGKFLRKTSLDELPQFFNVLRGDMSLVGPRPALAYELAEYDTWHKRRVFEAKPGITGKWQVMGRSTTSFDDMVRMDIQYIRKCSIVQDLILIVRTPFAVLMAKGAY